MNKKQLEEKLEALCNQYEGLALEIDDIRTQMQNMPDDDVPEMFDFSNEEEWFYVESYGIVRAFQISTAYRDALNEKRRLFKSREMAELFAEKTQLIADLLFLKEMFDRDYVPDWSSNSNKYFVYFDYRKNYYIVSYRINTYLGMIHFSSEEIAQKCADWLNSRLDKKEADDDE